MEPVAGLPAAPAAEELSPEQRCEVERAMAWLVVVPFTFPMWIKLRRDRPDLAPRLEWAGWFNVAQSVVCVAVLVLGVWALVALPPLIARYMDSVLR